MILAIILIIVSGFLVLWGDELREYSSYWESYYLTAFGWFVRIIAVILGFLGVIKLISELIKM